MNQNIRKAFYTDRFDIVEELEANYEKIKEDFFNVVTEDLYSKWPEKFLYNEGWNVFGLRFMQNDLKEAHELCPFISSMIRKYDSLIATAGFSILNAGTIIYPHQGYSDKLLRCHLGIEVPEGDCFLMVDSIKHQWKEGNAFVFDDTFEHQAWNSTKKRRIIMLLDLDRELVLNKFK
jgi:aspartyl/asparaginyl beta-hydroxylase (cupin superfamily)